MKRLRSALVPALCCLAMAIGLCTAASAHPGVRARAASLIDRLIARLDPAPPDPPADASRIASAALGGAARHAAADAAR